MADIAQSILDKLKIKARSTGKDYQLLLQLFCQEEFLRRLSRSEYRQNLILKGGLFLYCISGFQSRPTMDIDFLLRNLSNTEDSILKVIENVISTDTGSSIVNFEFLRLEPIAEHREYNGIRAKLVARIKNTRTPFDVDMGVGDIVVPKPEVKTLPTQLDGFESPSIYVYSLESTIAEKFDAIISRLELTSRMKDYFDIYYLAITYPFDGRKLQEAIFETLQKRGTPYDTSTLLEVGKFSEAPEMLAKWRHFVKTTLKASVDFKEVIDVIVKFVGPAFDAIIHESELLKGWKPEALGYEPYK
jgi:predicted nucleotidyltransferase component of viral defense system